MLVAISHHGRDFLRRARQRDGERQLAIGGERVGLERAAFVFGDDQAFGGQQSAEAGDDFIPAREDGGIEIGKGDG